MTVVYVENVFLLNWITDYLLLLTTARLAGAPLQRRRLAVCAALGGVYAVAVFVPGLEFLGHAIGKAAAGIGMTLLAYWPFRRPWRLMALFFLLSGALAGVVLGLSLASGSARAVLGHIYHTPVSWPVLVITAALMYLLLHLVFGQGARHGGGEVMTVTISVNQQIRKLLALHDTGNTLRDPVDGRAVLVLEQSVLQGVWPPQIDTILHQPIPPEEKMARLYQEGAGTAFTLLPFHSVGVSAGLLLAVRSDYVRIGGITHRRSLIALTDGSVSDGGAYQALWGGWERRGLHDSASAKAAKLDPKAQQAG